MPHDARITDRRREFEELADGLERPLWGTALRLTRNRTDADDLVQETWFRAFRSFHTFQRGTNFKAWIFRIQMNAFLNRRRRQVKEPLLSDFEKSEPVDRIHGNEVEFTPERADALFEEHLSDEVKAAVEALPEEYRAVLLLTSLGDLSYQETADALDIPIGTVMSRLHRARRRIRATLGAYARGLRIVRDDDAPGSAPAAGDGESSADAV